MDIWRQRRTTRAMELYSLSKKGRQFASAFTRRSFASFAHENHRRSHEAITKSISGRLERPTCSDAGWVTGQRPKNDTTRAFISQ